jgi:hypothetical protein
MVGDHGAPRSAWSRDVSEDIARELLDRAVDTDRNLGDDIKAFMDRDLGETARLSD